MRRPRDGADVGCRLSVAFGPQGHSRRDRCGNHRARGQGWSLHEGPVDTRSAHDLRVTTLDEWIDRVKARGHVMLEEKQLYFQIEHSGNIAHVRSRYVLYSDGKQVARGINSIQAIKGAGGRRVTDARLFHRSIVRELSNGRLVTSIDLNAADGAAARPSGTAMADVDRRILASRVRIEIIDPREIDARHCLRSYFEELDHRFDTGFDPAQSISASDDEMTLPNGLLLVAKLPEAAVGCGALKFHFATKIAEVKRMWVASHVRGLGLGRRLLERLSAEAALRGIVILRLETNRSLSEAKHLYERAGFVEVEPFNNEPYAHHWFQKDLRRQ